jgi:hypothetical protein
VRGRFVTTSDEASESVFQRYSSAKNGKQNRGPTGEKRRKRSLFLLRGKRGGEARKLDSGPELEGLAQFTNTATTGILAAITVPVPTGPPLVTPQFTHLRVPLLLAERLESGYYIPQHVEHSHDPRPVSLYNILICRSDCLGHCIVTRLVPFSTTFAMAQEPS